ncbi:MAG: heme exporter protein CcmB [Armatimonadota bacterium]|nr:heme exporter protein CcmB [Armatimonadota bacterium]MDR7452351.1 heme exporter protein CcmB [Armatimonadota bacterium]MDR7466911.1 heme exporter protein CcmB [Armatimonadota bacterium]MDR7493547.1 heme exporter protein CcmB [Armatimonadota bacterium]MDR7498812.1 heme exporter protein CcmB [Armatimonadota bacterium]
MNGFWAVFRKDLLIEWRARDLLPPMVVLALLLLAVTGAAGAGARSAPAMLWVTVAVAAAFGLLRSFQQETERDQLHGLRLAGVDPAALYLAKAAANFVLVGTVEIIALAAVVVFFDVSIPPRPALPAVLVLGTASLVTSGTLLGALLAAARAREALLPLLLLPLTTPAVAAAAGATARLLSPAGGSVVGEIRLLLAFTVLFLAIAVLLFEHIIEE